MDDRYLSGCRPACDDAGGLRIDPKGQFLFILCAVNGRIGSRVHDQIGNTTIKCRRDLFWLRKIEQAAVRPDGGSGRAESFAESRSDLPCHAGNQNAHQSRPYVGCNWIVQRWRHTASRANKVGELITYPDCRTAPTDDNFVGWTTEFIALAEQICQHWEFVNANFVVGLV